MNNLYNGNFINKSNDNLIRFHDSYLASEKQNILQNEIDREIFKSMIESSTTEEDKKTILSSFGLIKIQLPPLIINKETEFELLIKQVHEVYLNHNKKFFSNDVQKAKMLASLNKSNLDGYDAMLKDIWLGIIERTQLCIRSMIELIKQMPYIQKIIQIMSKN